MILLAEKGFFSKKCIDKIRKDYLKKHAIPQHPQKCKAASLEDSPHQCTTILPFLTDSTIVEGLGDQSNSPMSLAGQEAWDWMETEYNICDIVKTEEYLALTSELQTKDDQEDDDEDDTDVALSKYPNNAPTNPEGAIATTKKKDKQCASKYDNIQPLMEEFLYVDILPASHSCYNCRHKVLDYIYSNNNLGEQ